MTTQVFYLIFGIAAIISIFHLLLFVGRKKDLSNFYFFLFSLSVALMVLTHKILPLTNIKNNILLISQPLVTLFIINTFTLFVFNIYDLKKMKKIILFSIISLYITFSIFVYLFLNFKISLNNFYYVILIYSFLIFPMFLFLMFKENKLKNNRKRKLVFFGIIPFILYSLLMAALQSIDIRLPYGLNYLGYIIIITFFAYALIESFNKEHFELAKKTNKLVELTGELRKEKEFKERFFLDLAHETRNPLTLIDNYLDKYINLYGNNYEISIVKFNIEKLKAHICNYLDVEKIKLGHMLYDHDKIVELNNFIAKNVEIFRATAMRKKILVNYKENNKKIYLKIDPFAIDRIINNLLSNAYKFSPEGSIIEIGSRINENNIVEFYVMDSGCGIPAEQLENIFNPYCRLSQKGINTGVGMGLYIIKNIVNEVNGKIEIESTLNLGTTFRIKLNRYDLNLRDKVIENCSVTEKKITKINKIEKITNQTYNDSRNTLLIIEDDIEMLICLQSEFINDYNVFVATDGLDALEKLQAMPILPDLIISDIKMPNINGYDFYNNIKNNEKYNSIPLIFLTAKNTFEDRLKSLESGVIDFISKPFKNNEIKAKVTSIININKKQKQKNIKELENKISRMLNMPEPNREKSNITDDIQKKINSLSYRKKNILKLFISGSSYKEIADKLSIKENTVAKHMHDIYKTFEVNGQIDLIHKIYKINTDIFIIK